MNRTELAALAAALSRQTEGQVDGIVEPERIRQALTTGPRFTDAERRILWLSPDARDAYVVVRRQVDRELRARMRAAGYGEELQLRAAGDAGEVQTIRGRGYILTLFHDVEPVEEWSLSLQLEPSLRSILPPLASIRLYDRGRLTWIEGVPDQAGQLGAIWEHEGETPMQRAAQFGLILST